MKYFRLLTVTCLLQFTSICIAADAGEYTETRRPLNQVVAVVNDGIIVSSELGAAIVEVEKQLQAKNTQIPSRDVLAKQVLERLVVEKLQLQIAERSGTSIDDNALNEEIRTLAKENGMTMTDFRAVLERDGYDYPAFREDLRKQLLIQQTRRQMVGSRIKVTDQEVDNLLDSLNASGKADVEYHLAHILVSIPEAASPEQIASAESRANKLLERLRGGADFTSMAIAESDAQTALEGGDIGWRSIGQMPSLFVEPVKLMQAGQVSDLIRSSGGFHIVKLLEKRGDERHIMRQTLARHILLKPDVVNTDEDNLVRIQQLEIRLRGGEDFATLARANSQDTGSAAKGGDLGWLSPGDTVPDFETAMNALAPGEISAPVKTQFGWHLIQVQKFREHDSTEEFERNKARNLIRSRKYDEELFLWLRRLRDEAYVEYRLEDA